jgi:hypothetical protein
MKKLRKQLVWEGERPREPLRVRVLLTTGLRGRSPSLFFHTSRKWKLRDPRLLLPGVPSYR